MKRELMLLACTLLPLFAVAGPVDINTPDAVDPKKNIAALERRDAFGN